MSTVEILKSIIREMVDNGELSFGWDNSVKEYNFLEYRLRKLHNEYYSCLCGYSWDNKFYTKTIDVDVSRVTRIEREQKFNELGI